MIMRGGNVNACFGYYRYLDDQFLLCCTFRVNVILDQIILQ